MKTSRIKIKSRIKRKFLEDDSQSLRSNSEGNPAKKLRIMQISIGVIYLWFGALKFFSGVSPAEALAVETIQYLTVGILSPEQCLFMLAACETMIGLMLLLNFKKKYVIIAALLHLLGTFSPLVIMPDQIFKCTIFFLSLTGQYIVKNLIIFSSLLVLYPAKS
jgi:uncharacterized membrane protein YkgB